MNKFIIFFLFSFAANIYSSSLAVIYPNRDGVGEKAFGYQLLKLILPKTGKDYKVILDDKASNQDRALSELEKGNYSVVDTGIGAQFESRFDAVYIPIDMGLTGWRLFIINRLQSNNFKKIKTLSELRKKTAGQGTGWTDGDIIEDSRIKVLRAPKIENLINMVAAQRFDFFPLGINEVYGFLTEFGKTKKNLIVEKTLVLKYPFARLFYVKKGNKELHDDIQLGLERAFEDGSFINFIENHPFFKKGLKEANLKSRTVIEIKNPYLTKKFKQINPKWWYMLK